MKLSEFKALIREEYKKDQKAFRESFGLEENGDSKEAYQVGVEDFEQVVKAVKSTGHPATVGLDPKMNEIDIIIGMNAPDEISKDISKVIDSLPSRKRLSISGDSSSFGRGTYGKVEKINGGHTGNRFEESLEEDDEATIDAAIADLTNTEDEELQQAIDEWAGQIDKHSTQSNKLAVLEIKRELKEGDEVIALVKEEKKAVKVVEKLDKHKYRVLVAEATIRF